MLRGPDHIATRTGSLDWPAAFTRRTVPDGGRTWAVPRAGLRPGYVQLVLGRLVTSPALERPDLLAEPVLRALRSLSVGSAPALRSDQVLVAAIDPEHADTATFCATYDVPAAASANCVVVAGRRGAETRMAACAVLATSRADVNGVVRRSLDARKASFAAMEDAVAQTSMEYGGITPIGLPADWPVFVDRAVAQSPWVVVGSGLRRSKLVLPGGALGALPGACVLDGLGVPARPPG